MSTLAQTSLLIFALFSSNANAYFPVLCVPGFLAFDTNMEQLCQLIGQRHNGTITEFIQPDKTLLSAIGMWEQVELYRIILNEMFSKYPDGVNIVAHSQGTLIARAIVETTPNHPVKNFISIFGPFMGTYGVPKTLFGGIGLPQLDNKSLAELSVLLYLPASQAAISFAGYWNDPTQQELFMKSSLFLPYLNNLKQSPSLPVVNNLNSFPSLPIVNTLSSYFNTAEHKANILALNKLVLIGTDADDVIYPWQSELGGYYSQTFDIIPLQEQDVYTKDQFGLKTLDTRGDLVLIHVHNISHGGFLQATDMIDNDILPYCI